MNDLLGRINKITFQWDEQKNKINQQKHGISFEEAESVFFDDYAVQFWEEEHSQEEERFLLLGISSKMRILLVVHCFREEDSIIRIISARKPTKNESKEYRR
ncbi:BrnT family toxin [Microcoleus sp. herbarium14]|uniref:BrnT family toxin n=1 Tax=Microcoleus sp. herbarium14 TaxID=3055439 RepID=UPI002FCEF759